MPIKRYLGQPLPIVVGFSSNPFEAYNLDYSDITEVRMNFKKQLGTDADDAYLQKSSLTSGVLIDSTNHKFTMVMTTGDYTNLNAGETYYITLNVLLKGITDFVELEIQDRGVKIESDTNRA